MAVEHGIITSVMPPGGWHYPQVLSTGETVKLTGFTFEQIQEAMLDFRRRHPDLCGGSRNGTIESVRADLKAYLCAHFRQNCADSPGSPAITARQAVRNQYVTPIEKAGDWLAKIAHHRLEKIDPALASQRAQICAMCPQNIHWNIPCASCNDNIQVRVQNAKGSFTTAYDRRLFSCRYHGWINEVAIWLADPMSNASKDHQPPGVCWHQQHGQ
jgi:hypothetical protein